VVTEFLDNGKVGGLPMSQDRETVTLNQDDIKAAAKQKIATMSDAQAWQHLEGLAAASKVRTLTPQEELEAVNCFFGPTPSSSTKRQKSAPLSYTQRFPSYVGAYQLLQVVASFIELVKSIQDNAEYQFGGSTSVFMLSPRQVCGRQLGRPGCP
jgi:hypothetical protein